MLLPSMGFTCGTFFSNEARFTTGTMISVPEISCGSTFWMTFSSAIIEAYSVPCAPETSARVGPGLAPLMTTTGMFVPGSIPAGTWRKPVLFSPETAVAVPTETLVVCADNVTDSEKSNAVQYRIKSPLQASLRQNASTVRPRHFAATSLSVHDYGHGSRRNSVGHHHEIGRSGFHSCWHVILS